MRRRHLLLLVAATAAFFMAGIHNGNARLVLKHCSQQYLHRGDHGACVKAASYLLTAQGKPARKELRQNPYFHFRKTGFTSHFGRGMVRDTIRAKYRLGYPRNEINGVWGPNLWAYIVGSKLIPIDWRTTAGKRYNRHVHAARIAPKRAVAAELTKWARYLIRQGGQGAGHIHYSQGDYRMSVLSHHTKFSTRTRLPYTLYTDCSAFVTIVYYQAYLHGYRGVNNPNGYRGWPPYGYTGSLAQGGHLIWRRGQSIARITVGAWILYGNGPPFDHTAYYLGRGRVASHGHEGGPYDVPLFYRFDAYEARAF